MAKLPERDLETFWTRLKDVYEYFKSRGISDEIAAGILGNVAREASGFWDNVVNKIKDKKGNIRYFYGGVQNEQLTYDWVKANYGGYTKKHQILYLADGLLGKLPEIKSKRGNLLNTRFTDFMNKAKKTKSPSLIAYLWESIYELSGKSQLDERLLCAEYFYKLMLKNKTKQNKKSKSNKTSELLFPNYDIYQQFLPELFTAEQSNNSQYLADNLKSEFDLPLLATQFRNGGRLIKKHQYGGTLASRYIQRYFDPNNPLMTYVNFGDAQKAGVQFTNDINNPNSGAYFSYEILNDQQGEDENNRLIINNIQGHKINPQTTYAAIDNLGRIINNKNYNVIVNRESLIPTNGYVFDETRGWIPALPTSNGLIIDLDMLDLAEQAARFLSDRGFEHAWRMSPEERIKFARSVLQSDAAGYATVFGALIPGALSSAYKWATGTNAGRAFTTSMLAGEAFDEGSRALTGLSYGLYMASLYGGSPFLWGLTNPGYLLGGNLIAPAKELVEPVIKEATNSLVSKITQAGKNLLDKNLESSNNTSTTIGPISDDKVKAATDYVNKLLSIGHKNAKIYTTQEANDIADQLASHGLDLRVPDYDVTFIGHAPVNNIMNKTIRNLLNYRLSHFYKPIYPIGTTVAKDGSLVDFRIPEKTYFIIDADGNLVLKKTRSGKEYTSDMVYWPSFIANFPKKSKSISGTFLSAGGTKAAFNLLPIRNDLTLQLVSKTDIHEIFGHGMNDIAKAVQNNNTGLSYSTELGKILTDLNPEIVSLLKKYFSKVIDEDELLALFKQTWSPIIEHITSKEGLTPVQIREMSESNLSKLQQLFEKYVDEASAEDLKNWMGTAGSLYSDFVNMLLPTKRSLADALENNADTHNILLDIVADTLRRKNISYTMEEANALMNKIKNALKYGFSIALPTSTLTHTANLQNTQN